MEHEVAGEVDEQVLAARLGAARACGPGARRRGGGAASAGSGASASSISRPPSAAFIRRAARWIVSPSGIRPAQPGGDEPRGWREKPAAMICSSRPEPITGSPSTRSIPSFGISLLARRLGEPRDRLDQRLALELDQPHDPLAAALDVDDRVAVAQQDVGAGRARRAAGPRPRFGHAQRGAVGLRRVGRGEQQVLALALRQRRAGARPRRRARTGRRRGPRRSSRGGRCPASPGSRARRRGSRSRPARPRRARVSRVTIP